LSFRTSSTCGSGTTVDQPGWVDGLAHRACTTVFPFFIDLTLDYTRRDGATYMACDIVVSYFIDLAPDGDQFNSRWRPTLELSGLIGRWVGRRLGHRTFVLCLALPFFIDRGVRNFVCMWSGWVAALLNAFSKHLCFNNCLGAFPPTKAYPP